MKDRRSYEFAIALTTAIQSAILAYKKRSGMQSHYTIAAYRQRIDGTSIGATRKWFDRYARGDLPKSVVDLDLSLKAMGYKLIIIEDEGSEFSNKNPI